MKEPEGSATDVHFVTEHGTTRRKLMDGIAQLADICDREKIRLINTQVEHNADHGTVTLRDGKGPISMGRLLRIRTQAAVLGILLNLSSATQSGPQGVPSAERTESM